MRNVKAYTTVDTLCSIWIGSIGSGLLEGTIMDFCLDSMFETIVWKFLFRIDVVYVW